METRTLTQLIAEVRQRSNMESTTFVTDSEITHYLMDEIRKLHGKIANIDDGSLLGTVSPTLTQIGDNAYQLPSDFMRLIDVNIYTGDRWVPSFPADPQDYLSLLTRSYTGDFSTLYFLKLNLEQGRYELFLFPSKDPDNIGVRYIQEHPTLSLGSDTLNWPSAWHVVPILGAAIKCIEKEESDATGLIYEYNTSTQSVLKDVRTQKVAEVETIRQLGYRNRRRARRGFGD
jgi:hypothetical protein